MQRNRNHKQILQFKQISKKEKRKKKLRIFTKILQVLMALKSAIFCTVTKIH